MTGSNDLKKDSSDVQPAEKFARAAGQSFDFFIIGSLVLVLEFVNRVEATGESS